jgi:hypothetical protein
MIPKPEIPTTEWPQVPNGKMCPRIGNARFAVRAKTISRKRSKLLFVERMIH